MPRDYTAELKNVQERTRTIQANRDRIIREVGSEERKVQEAYDQLKALGIIQDATSRFTVEELDKRSAVSQQKLASVLDVAHTQIAAGEALWAEYEATATV